MSCFATVAAAAGMDVAHLSKIELGQRTPTEEQALKLAKFFGVPAKEMLARWIAERFSHFLCRVSSGTGSDSNAGGKKPAFTGLNDSANCMSDIDSQNTKRKQVRTIHHRN